MNIDPQSLNVVLDADGTEVREYLQNLLVDLWWQGEGFNSKRPFGSSGWQLDVILPLVESGFIPGEMRVDEDGEKEFDYDENVAREYVSELIVNHLFAREAK